MAAGQGPVTHRVRTRSASRCRPNGIPDDRRRATLALVRFCPCFGAEVDAFVDRPQPDRPRSGCFALGYQGGRHAPSYCPFVEFHHSPVGVGTSRRRGTHAWRRSRPGSLRLRRSRACDKQHQRHSLGLGLGLEPSCNRRRHGQQPQHHHQHGCGPEPDIGPQRGGAAEHQRRSDRHDAPTVGHGDRVCVVNGLLPRADDVGTHRVGVLHDSSGHLDESAWRPCRGPPSVPL